MVGTVSKETKVTAVTMRVTLKFCYQPANIGLLNANRGRPPHSVWASQESTNSTAGFSDVATILCVVGARWKGERWGYLAGRIRAGNRRGDWYEENRGFDFINDRNSSVSTRLPGVGGWSEGSGSSNSCGRCAHAGASAPARARSD